MNLVVEKKQNMQKLYYISKMLFIKLTTNLLLVKKTKSRDWI